MCKMQQRVSRASQVKHSTSGWLVTLMPMPKRISKAWVAPCGGSLLLMAFLCWQPFVGKVTIECCGIGEEDKLLPCRSLFMIDCFCLHHLVRKAWMNAGLLSRTLALLYIVSLYVSRLFYSSACTLDFCNAWCLFDEVVCMDFVVRVLPCCWWCKEARSKEQGRSLLKAHSSKKLVLVFQATSSEIPLVDIVYQVRNMCIDQVYANVASHTIFGTKCSNKLIEFSKVVAKKNST